MCPHARLRLEGSLGEHRTGDQEIDEQKIRCVLADEHVLLREGIKRLLEDEPDMRVVAEAGNAAEALRRIFECRPDVVIASVRMFGCAEDQAERLILRESPQSKVLFLDAHEEDRAVTGSRASCTVLTSAEELVAMVRARVSQAAVREMTRSSASYAATEEFVSPRRVLTSREREILKLLAEGKTVRSAADTLGLSAKTVDSHKFNLMRKLGIHNKAELVMWAVQKRIVKVPANY